VGARQAYRVARSIAYGGVTCRPLARAAMLGHGRDGSFGADSSRVVLSARSSLFDPSANSPIATSE
jgi:hypothetical protein